MGRRKVADCADFLALERTVTDAFSAVMTRHINVARRRLSLGLSQLPPAAPPFSSNYLSLCINAVLDIARAKLSSGAGSAI